MTESTNDSYEVAARFDRMDFYAKWIPVFGTFCILGAVVFVATSPDMAFFSETGRGKQNLSIWLLSWALGIMGIGILIRWSLRIVFIRETYPGAKVLLYSQFFRQSSFRNGIKTEAACANEAKKCGISMDEYLRKDDISFREFFFGSPLVKLFLVAFLAVIGLFRFSSDFRDWITRSEQANVGGGKFLKIESTKRSDTPASVQ